MNDTPHEPIPTISDSLARLIKAHDSMAGALTRVEGLTDHLSGPADPARPDSTVVADARPGLAVTLANIVAQFEATSLCIVDEVVAIEKAIG